VTPLNTSDPALQRLRDMLDALDALDDRHQARMAMLDSVAVAEQRLRDELHRGQTPSDAGFWARLRTRWSPPPTPHASELTERHEAMVRAVRGLSFHLVALEGAVDTVVNDKAEVLSLAFPTGSEPSATQQTLTDRAMALSDLLQAEHEVLSIRHEGLVELHTAAHDVAHALSRQALQHHLAGPRTVRSPALDGVVRAAIERAAELHHRVDTLESRMRQLDAEARERRVAKDEVEAWLRPGTSDA